MFKLQPNPTFKAKVPIVIPGQEKPAQVEMEFKYITRSQRAEFFEAAVEKTDLENVMQIVVGWAGVDAAFSAESMETLLDNYPSAARGIFDAFNREYFEARAKN